MQAEDIAHVQYVHQEYTLEGAGGLREGWLVGQDQEYESEHHCLEGFLEGDSSDIHGIATDTVLLCSLIEVKSHVNIFSRVHSIVS